MNWDARIRLITVVRNPDEEQNAHDFLKTLIALARLPQTLTEVRVGDFKTVVSNDPAADLNVFGMDENLPFDFVI